MGHVGGRRFSVGEFHAASKTSSANGSHLNVWCFDISAAEFPQQKKTCVFGVNRPRPIHTKNARLFGCGYSAADISKPHAFKWDPLADDVLEAA